MHAISDYTQCILCPAGFYCPSGTASDPTDSPVPCPPGTYNNNTNTGHPINCKRCPPGFACPFPNQTSYTLPCKEGESLLMLILTSIKS